MCVCVCVCILKRDKRNFDKSENKTQSRHGAVGQPGCSAVHTLYYTRDCITQSAAVLHNVIVLRTVQLYYTRDCITYRAFVLHTM